MVQPCDQSRVRVVLGAHLGQGEAGQIGKLGRLGEGHAELLYDAVQLVGFRLLELDTNLVQDKGKSGFTCERPMRAEYGFPLQARSVDRF